MLTDDDTAYARGKEAAAGSTFTATPAKWVISTTEQEMRPP